MSSRGSIGEDGEIRLPRAPRDPAAGHARQQVRAALFGIDEPARFGRYVVLAPIGRGAMGTVFACYDATLDRKIAVKVIHRDDSDDSLRRRILAEAQALARVRHANVIHIYEVAEHGEDLFIAMELVEGGASLRSWAAERSRPWREALDVFFQVGAGLAAVHNAGVVHGDFKPDNVLLDPSGHAFVVDFGLARLAEIELADAFGADERSASRSSLARPGTPAYMAPEQFERGETDALSDQYAFCISLFEALHGRRPFTASSLDDLVDAKAEGRVDDSGTRRRIPRWLDRALRRGFSPRPEDRFASMELLLNQLRKGQSRARLRLAAAGIGAALLVGGGVKGLDRLEQHRARARCESEGAAVSASWPAVDGSRRVAVGTALLATRTDHANTTAIRVQAGLDAYAEAWRQARIDACNAARERGWTVELAARSVECFEERQELLDALVEQLLAADAVGLRRAIHAVVGLPAVESCTDEMALRRRPEALEAAEERRHARRHLAEASALARIGRFDDAARSGEEALAEIQALGNRAATARAKAEVSAMLELAGAYARAEQVSMDAYFEARDAGLPETAHDAAVLLTIVVGDRLVRRDAGRLWARLAGLELAAMGEDEAGVVAAQWLDARASLELTAGVHDEAKRLFSAALSAREATLGASHPETARSLHNLAIVATRAGAYAESDALFRRALAVHEEVLGPQHPDVATVLDNLGATHADRGEVAEATELHTRALAIREAALGPMHPDVALSLLHIANVRRLEGRLPDARAALERAVPILEAALGPDHPRVGAALDILAAVYFDEGSFADALPLNERALAIIEAALGPDHRNVATALDNLGMVQQELGAPARAVPLHERASKILERALGPDHPQVGSVMTQLSNAHHALGDLEQARSLELRALKIKEATLGADNPRVAASVLHLARLDVAAGRLGEAEDRFERALAIFERALGRDHPQVGEILYDLAKLDLKLDDPEEAVARARRAIAIRERRAANPAVLAATRLLLARALWARGERSPAIDIAVTALRTAAGSEPIATEIARWLRRARAASR